MAIYYKPRSSFWDQMNQRQALGQPIDPATVESGLYGERYGELSTYYDQSNRNKQLALQERQVAVQEQGPGLERERIAMQREGMDKQSQAAMVSGVGQLAVAAPLTYAAWKTAFPGGATPAIGGAANVASTISNVASALGGTISPYAGIQAPGTMGTPFFTIPSELTGGVSTTIPAGGATTFPAVGASSYLGPAGAGFGAGYMSTGVKEIGRMATFGMVKNERARDVMGGAAAGALAGSFGGPVGAAIGGLLGGIGGLIGGGK